MNWTGTHTQRVINNKHTLALAVAHTHTKFNCIALIMQSEFLDNLCDAMSHPTALEIRSGICDLGCGIDCGALTLHGEGCGRWHALLYNVILLAKTCRRWRQTGQHWNAFCESCRSFVWVFFTVYFVFFAVACGKFGSVGIKVR